MIVDRIENAHLYYGLGGSLAEAMRFLKERDLSAVTRETLADGAVRAGMVAYTTRPLENCKRENHRREADIHVCLEGIEVIGYCHLADAQPVTGYDETIDKQFYSAPLDFIRLRPGMFALMLPEDVHCAMAADGECAPAKKLLLKCRL